MIFFFRSEKKIAKVLFFPVRECFSDVFRGQETIFKGSKIYFTLQKLIRAWTFQLRSLETVRGFPVFMIDRQVRCSQITQYDWTKIKQPRMELSFDEKSYHHVSHFWLDSHFANMDYSEFFPEMSPMDEILERDFSSDVCGPDWSHNHRLGDLVGEDNFENVLLQTRLDLDNFETESIASSEPQSPLDLQVGKNQPFTDDELISISIRLLNQQLKNLPKAEAKQIRKRRRSLKNRGYATLCRQRRTALKESLEQQNKRLKLELKEAKENLYNTLRDRDMFKKKYEQLHALLSSRKRNLFS